jgi:CBS domain-containing protein
MIVNEVMTRGLDQIDVDSTLKEAAILMDKQNVGCLAVVEGGQVVGMVSDRDIVIRGVASGADPTDMRVGHVMSAGAVSCRFDDEVGDVARTMGEYKVRRVLVRDAKKIPIGIVSVGDIAARAHETHLAGDTMETICHGL